VTKYLGKSVANRAIPIYLRTSKRYLDSDSKIRNLPKDTNWSTKTRIYFRLGTLEKCVEWSFKNKRPILFVVDGQSGEGKTSVVIYFLYKFLKRYARVTFTPENFRHYFRLGRHVGVDPRRMAKEFKTGDFFAVDEARLCMSSKRAMSDQNLKVNDFTTQIREKQIAMFAIATSKDQLDKEFIQFNNIFRISVDYNDMRSKSVRFNVQVNCVGMDGADRVFEYVVLESERWIYWNNPTLINLWKASKQLKEDVVYGGTNEGYRDYKAEQKGFESGEAEEFETEQQNTILMKYPKKETTEKTVRKLVLELLTEGWNYTETEMLVNEHFKKNLVNYRKIKAFEAKAKIRKR
jgi:hypothetical protein